MSRLKVQREWRAAGVAAEVLERAEAVIAAQGGRVVTRTSTGVTFRRGSQLATRFLGGWFASLTQLPLEGMIEAVPVGSALQVKCWLSERLGVGVFDSRTAARYQDALNTFLEAIERAIGPVED